MTLYFLLKHVLIRGLLLPLAACLYLVRYAVYGILTQSAQLGLKPQRAYI